LSKFFKKIFVQEKSHSREKVGVESQRESGLEAKKWSLFFKNIGFELHFLCF
jgi:hypothetical protein